MPKSAIDRRRLVAGSLAAGTAIAGAAIGARAALGAEADAELLELGRRFEELYARWYPLHCLEYEAGQCVSRAVDRLPRGMPTAEFERRLHEADAEFEHSAKARAAYDVEDELIPVADRIMALPAVTLAGIAVKARTMRHAAVMNWHEDLDDLDYPDERLRLLVEAIEAAAGYRGA